MDVSVCTIMHTKHRRAPGRIPLLTSKHKESCFLVWGCFASSGELESSKYLKIQGEMSCGSGGVVLSSHVFSGKTCYELMLSKRN